MNVLGIETSCDETAVAAVRDGRTILANAIYSQIARHAVYGGVVPEVAARAHLEVLPSLTQQALDQAGLSWGDIHCVAATRGPGLATSLVMGFSAAKALAVRLEVPLLGVNHLEAHLYSVLLDQPRAPAEVLPALVLLVSGGHTCLVRFEGAGRHQLLGQTLDDAAGEALDKGAKLLGMAYPGGPLLEQAARGGDPHRVDFPRGLARDERRGTRSQRPDLCFSFSGLKTALRYHLQRNPGAIEGGKLTHVAASYQHAVVDTLATQVERALDDVPVRALAAAGGVARNGLLRDRLAEVARARGLPLLLAQPDYCTDNAAMIAALGGALLAAGAPPTPLDADIDPNLPLG
jgi:N6-L-threonylcarbamoyladenine synthase